MKVKNRQEQGVKTTKRTLLARSLTTSLPRSSFSRALSPASLAISKGFLNRTRTQRFTRLLLDRNCLALDTFKNISSAALSVKKNMKSHLTNVVDVYSQTYTAIIMSW